MTIFKLGVYLYIFLESSICKISTVLKSQYNKIPYPNPLEQMKIRTEKWVENKRQRKKAYGYMQSIIVYSRNNRIFNN